MKRHAIKDLTARRALGVTHGNRQQPRVTEAAEPQRRCLTWEGGRGRTLEEVQASSILEGNGRQRRVREASDTAKGMRKHVRVETARRVFWPISADTSSQEWSPSTQATKGEQNSTCAPCHLHSHQSPWTYHSCGHPAAEHCVPRAPWCLCCRVRSVIIPRQHCRPVYIPQ